MSKEQSTSSQATDGKALQGRFDATLVDGLDLARICRHTVASPGDAALLTALNRRYPALEFRLAHASEAWYRIGGVMDARGERLATDISEWTGRAFLECGQNFKTLVRHCRDQGLVATRHHGLTLQIVASLGDKAEDFLQLEVDRTQEVRDRALVDADRPPRDMETLLGSLAPLETDCEPLGPPLYVYRRKTEVAVFMRELGKRLTGKHPVHRFLDNWNRSSAGRHRRFCQEWSLKLQPLREGSDKQKMDVAVLPGPTLLPRLDFLADTKGAHLRSVLTHFDRRAGFPFAWFFYMAARRHVPPLLGEAVYRNLEGDFADLSHRDAAILREWIADPYFV